MVTAHILNEWEVNGYNDSDFYYALWIPSEGKVVAYEYDSTRHAGMSGHPYTFEPLTDDVLEEARQYLEEKIFENLQEFEDNRLKGEVMFEKGAKIRLLKDVNFKNKRERDEEGNPTLVQAKKGETGTVIWQGHYGQFYRNGYRKPCRENQRIGIRFADGRVVFCAATSAALVVGDPMSTEKMKEMAHRMSFSYQFKNLVSLHKGWLTRNAAKEFGC